MGKLGHVIVLMLENRSFDHMFGYLKHPSPKFDGLKGNESCPDANGNPVKVSAKATYSIHSPDHSHAGIMQQLLQEKTSPPYKPTNKGFVQNYEETSPGHGADIMRCFDPQMIPVLTTLAREFAVCTRWFCSLPGETWPNREFVHSATSRGRAGFSGISYLAGLYSTQRTVFELIEDAGNTWRIYHDDTPHTWCYTALWDTPFKRNRFQPINKLYEDIRLGKLASYTFVEPDYGLALVGSGWGNSQHPGQAPSRDEFLAGERLISKIYEELKANMDLFARTVFVITYDEHGGFYDHVPPEKTVNPDGKKWKGKFDFDLLGVRVPAVIVSPWIERGRVDDRRHDHTSIIQSLRILFGNGQDPLTERDKHAIPFHDILSETLRPQSDLPFTLPLSTADGERLEERIQGAGPKAPRPVGAVLDQGLAEGEFHAALRALSASVGNRLALEANGKVVSPAGLSATAPLGGRADAALNPAAVIQRFRASADLAPPPKSGPSSAKRPTKKPKATSARLTRKSGPSSPGSATRRDEIAVRVSALLASVLGQDPSLVLETLAIRKDLGFDDASIRDLAFPLTGLVRRYSGQTVSRDEIGAAKTVGDLITVVLSKC